MSNKYIAQQEFEWENASKRIPVCIVVDTSGSMSHTDGFSLSRMERVNKGIADFYDDIRKNPNASQSVEVAILSIGSSVNVVQDFTPVKQNPQHLKCRFEKCDLASGIEKALELLDDRKRLYDKYRIGSYQPWLIIMSDGDPNYGEDQKVRISAAIKEVRKREDAKKISVFSVLVLKEPPEGYKTSDDTLLGREKRFPYNYSTYKKRMQLMDRFTRYQNRLIKIDLDDETSFEYLFQFLSRSASSIASNQGMINDSKYGDFKDEDSPKRTITTSVYKNLDETNISTSYVDEISDMYKRVNKNKNITDKHGMTKPKSKIIDLLYDDTESNDNDVLGDEAKTNRKINLYVNGVYARPYKIFNEDKTDLVLRLSKNDDIKIEILPNNKIAFHGKIAIPGKYTFTVDDNDNVSFAFIKEETIEKKNTFLRRRKKNEIEVNKDTINWDEI